MRNMLVVLRVVMGLFFLIFVSTASAETQLFKGSKEAIAKKMKDNCIEKLIRSDREVVVILRGNHKFVIAKDGLGRLASFEIDGKKYEVYCQ